MSQIQAQKLFITEAEAAIRYGYSRQWFQRSRWQGRGPKFIKVGSGKILYPISATDEWFMSFGLQQSTSTNMK